MSKTEHSCEEVFVVACVARRFWLLDDMAIASVAADVTKRRRRQAADREWLAVIGSEWERRG
jgi:hypothetical protein